MDANTTFTGETKLEILSTNIDQFFLVIMGMCIIFMQCGFAFLEAGAVRSKNVTNILIKNFFDLFVSGVGYWLFGYAFAFGEGNDFIGYSNFASHKLEVTGYAMFFFQYTFAATAATIVSGAVAERCDFIAYLVYSFGITGFIYPVVTHWLWGGGFLAKGVDYGGDVGTVAYQDFAGSGIVHVLGGVASFCGALLLGPRIGRFHKETKTIIPIRGHSVPIAALGGFILFFGFLAFNGGSQTSIQNEGDGAAVSVAVVNTMISGSFAAFSSLLINKSEIFGNAHWSLLITINGALTGMVAACAGCNVMLPWMAAILGIVSGALFHFWSFVIRRVGVDDPLDAVAVHFGGGSWGVIAVAFFNKEEGILMAGNQRSGMMLAWQFAGLAVIMCWTGCLCFLMFGILRLLKMLRVPEEVELKGLDIAKHNEPAYPVEAYGHGHIEKILQWLEKGPLRVTQGFETMNGHTVANSNGKLPTNGHLNNGFIEVSDQGPYEHPEIQSTIIDCEITNDKTGTPQPQKLSQSNNVAAIKLSQ